ncbi:MAG: hypothetical protein K8F91_21510, partial [Candidatus Obscuribacterales bacterium]|nr:hypothetical protein [Candidatus Obscuribacterales bacterium]
MAQEHENKNEKQHLQYLVKWTNIGVPSAFCLMLSSISACSNDHDGISDKLPAISMESIRLGSREEFFADNLFLRHESPRATKNTSYYLSRGSDENGRHFSARVVDGTCTDVFVVMDRPESRESTVNLMKTLFPSNRPELTECDSIELSISDLVKPIEYFYFGTIYGAEID